VFSTRKIQPELLDHCKPELARANLADLVRINRDFGGHSTLRHLLRQVAASGDTFSLLDIGAASGDTAALIQEAYPRAVVTSLDHSAVNLAGAPNPKVLADAFALPFASNSVDFVLSSLFLHHFTDDAVRQLLRGFSRVARRAVLISDLERRWLPYIFLRVTQPLFRWSFVTVHDGLRSVRAAFRAPELYTLAMEAGFHSATVETHRPAFRVTLVASKSP
jgi:ubiquinone/menaquinone biosynthesis C-methylase UbiE